MCRLVTGLRGAPLGEHAGVPHVLRQLAQVRDVGNPAEAARRTVTLETSELDDALANGEIREDADIDVAVNTLVGSFYGRYLYAGDVPDDWVGRVVGTLWDGLRHR